MVTGGRERSVSEIKKLLQLAGFSYSNTQRLNSVASIVVGVAE